MTTIACRRYFRMNSGVRIPILERNQETIGSSNTTPAASMTLMMKFMYSLMAMLFSIVGVPKPAKNCSAAGSMTKYAKATPARKQNEENTTMDRMYFRSFGSSPGAMKAQIW